MFFGAARFKFSCKEKSWWSVAFVETEANSSKVEPKNFRPFWKAQELSIIQNLCVPPRISALLIGRSPSAVTRGVIAIFIWIAIKTVSWWAFPHVGKECLKGPPSFADLDAATSIKMPRFLPWVRASCKHRGPGLIGGRFTTIRSSNDRVADSHVMCSLMALVRGRVSVQALRGFAILAVNRYA